MGLRSMVIAMDITVVGTGLASLAPERATITLSAAHEGADKAQVLARTSELVQALTTEIARLRDHESKPTTWSAVLPIGTRSWRPWSEKGEVLPLRHAASSTIRIKFRDFRALSGFADAWGGVEGITLGGVEWTLTEEVQKKTEREVLAQAVEQARDRAQVLATAGGGGRVRCIELADPGLLSDRASTEMAPKAMAMRSGAYAGDSGGSGGIEIAPQDVEVEAQINARFVADVADPSGEPAARG